MPIVWQLPNGTLSVMQLHADYLTANQLPGEATADAVMRLAVIEQAKQPDLAGAVPVLVASRNIPSTKAQRKQWRLNAGAVSPDANVPGDPDHVGFLGALKTAFPIQARNSIAQKYPWFIRAVEDKNWADVQDYITMALADGVLTQQQYDTIKSVAAQKFIPITL